MCEVTIDGKELWGAVFGSAFECFGTHWHEVDFLEGDDETPGKVRLVIIDEMTEELTEKTVGLEDILKALPIANSQVSIDLLDYEDYDAVAGDAVLQVAVLGEVVYG